MTSKRIANGSDFCVQPVEQSAACPSHPRKRAGRSWRPRPELNRGTRICSPLRHHSATWPSGSGYIGPFCTRQRAVWCSKRLRQLAFCGSLPQKSRTFELFQGPVMTDFAAARRMMVDGQVRTADVTDLRLLAAMGDVPRERFVPQAKAEFAYLDLDLPAGESGTRRLLKPMV